MASTRKTAVAQSPSDGSLESWGWDAACTIRGAKDAPKYKDFILPSLKEILDLFILCELGLLQQEGKGRATHYTPKNSES
jgi:hypothetical protein